MTETEMTTTERAPESAPEGTPGGDGPPTSPPARPPAGARLRRDVGWRSRDILRAAALVAAVWIALRLLWFANEIFLLTFLGVLFGLALSAGVDRLQRFRMPRGMGAALIVLSILAAMYGIGALMAPTVATQARELRNTLPDAIDRVENWLAEQHGSIFGALLRGFTQSGASTTAPAPGASDTTDRARAAAGGARPAADTIVQRSDSAAGAAPASPLRDALSQQLRRAADYLFPFVTSTLAILGGVLLILVLAIYTAAEPGLYRRGIMHLIPHRARPDAERVLTEVGSVLRRWLITQLIAMLVIGVVSTIALLLLNVRAAFVLGIIAGLLEFVPMVGPIMSAVPAIAMGFLDSPEKALWVALAYLGIQQVENHLLIPVLMKEGLDLPPAVTIVSQALMALLFGFLGLLVAVPLVAAVVAAVKMLYVEDVVGDDVPLLTEGAGGG